MPSPEQAHESVHDDVPASPHAPGLNHPGSDRWTGGDKKVDPETARAFRPRGLTTDTDADGEEISTVEPLLNTRSVRDPHATGEVHRMREDGMGIIAESTEEIPE